MASVLHLSQLQPPLSSAQKLVELGPLSLSLDLSLGGLFSTPSNGHGPEDSFGPHPVVDSSMPVSQFLVPELCRSAQSISLQKPEKQSPEHLQGDCQSLNERSMPPKEADRCVHAQVRRDARKKRKSLNDCKISKKGKTEEFHRTELDFFRPPSFFEFLKPGEVVNQEKLLIHEDEGRGDESIIEDSGCKVEMPSVVPGPNDHIPGPCTPVSSLAESRITIDETDSMNSGNASVSCIPDTQGGSWYPASQPSQRFPADCNKMSEQAPNKLRLDVKSVSRSSTSSSSARSTPSAPCESKQAIQLSVDDSCCDSYSQGTLQERAFPSQLLSCDIRDQSDARCKIDEAERTNGISNSSESRTENQCIGNDHGDPSLLQWPASPHFTDEQVGQAKSGDTPTFAYSLPAIPLPYPFGPPAPWSFPHSWFPQGVPETALGVPLPHPAAANGHLREASAKSFGGFPNPYLTFPMSGSTVAMCLPAVPAVMQAVDASPDTTIAVLPSGKESNKFAASVYRSRELPDKVIEEIGSSSIARATKDHAMSTMHTEKMQPADESLKEPRSCLGDCACSEMQFTGKVLVHPGKSKGVLKRGGRLSDDRRSTRPGETASQNFLPADRQQSLPLEYEKMPKKKKVVRFNSLSIAEAEMRGESVRCPSRYDKMTAFQKCAMRSSRLSHSNSHVDSKRASVAASIKELQAAKPVSNGSNDSLAIDATNFDGQIIDAEVDQEEKALQSCSTASATVKSALKNKCVAGQSIANLPRVITRGLGPRGRTIHGVLYISPEKQVRLMCICHGEHMSALEFVQHSGSSDLSNPERNIILESVACSESDV